jgi:hypothetical protein
MAQKRVSHTLFLLALGASAVICLGYAKLRYEALDLNPVDFSYYYQFAASLAHPDLSDKISWCPRGINMFGLAGRDGENHFHAAVHFEPVKYVYVAILSFALSPFVLFAFLFAVFASPAVYSVWHYRDHRLLPVASLLAGLYLLMPSAPILVANNLRPFVLLGPAFCISMLAIFFRRSDRQVFLAYGLPFLVREEAMVLAAIAIAFAIAMRRGRGLLLAMAALYVLYAFVLHRYFQYGGLAPLDRATGIPHVSILPLPLACLATVVLATFYAVVRLRPQYPWPGIAAGSVLVPLVAAFLRPLAASRGLVDFVVVLLGERFPLFNVCAWLLVALFIFSRIDRMKYGVVVGCGAIATLSMLLLTVFMQHLEHVRLGPARDAAAAVWDTKASQSAVSSRILCDRTTFQAFCEYEQVEIIGHIKPPLSSVAEQSNPARWVLASGVDAFALGRRVYAALARTAPHELRAYTVKGSNATFVCGELNPPEVTPAQSPQGEPGGRPN